ncbi:MAG: hypothetical protein PHR35_14320 [Kiritimatiellae bacterium]|nr:hypothetical protein [Kiritimatiellia bacterium]
MSLCALATTSLFAAEQSACSVTNAAVGRGGLILFDFKVLQMDVRIAEEVFGEGGVVAPGGVIANGRYANILQSPHVSLISAPRVVSRPGQSAQIDTTDERHFITGFKMNEKTGEWKPDVSNLMTGNRFTICATPYPGDPERFQGAAEVALCRVVRVDEKTLPLPGRSERITLQCPVTETRAFTSAFDARRGETIVLGSFDGPESTNGYQTVVVLLSINSSK